MQAQPSSIAAGAPAGSSPYVLTAVFAIALALRAGVALWLPQEVVWPDGERYERVALNLLQGEGFGGLGDNRRSVPTQPLLIASVYSVFGQNYLAARLFFAVLGAASCVLGSMLATKLLGRASGLFAGLFLAGYPYLVYLSALFEYPQTFFIFIMAVFFLLYYRFRETGSYRALFFAATCLGLAVLSVPTALIFAAAFGVLLVTRSVRETLTRVGVCAVAAAITVGAWSARNYVAYDSFVLVNAAGGRNFWLGNNETYWQHGKAGVVPPCGEGYEHTRYCEETRAVRAYVRGLGLGEVESILEEERIAWQRGLAFAKEDPGRFAVLSGRKLLDFWRPTPDAVRDGGAYGGRWRDFVAAASYVPLALLAVLGLVSSAAHWRRLLPIYVYVVAFVAPYGVFFPTTRYRLPIDFVLIIFAGAGFARLWSAVASRRGRRAAAAGAPARLSPLGLDPGGERS